LTSPLNSKKIIQFGTDGNDFLKSISASNGILYAAGSTTSQFPTFTSKGGSDCFIVKFDISTYTQLWTNQFGTSSDDSINSIRIEISNKWYK
jgi:hypothetical protein